MGKFLATNTVDSQKSSTRKRRDGGGVAAALHLGITNKMNFTSQCPTARETTCSRLYLLFRWRSESIRNWQQQTPIT